MKSSSQLTTTTRGWIKTYRTSSPFTGTYLLLSRERSIQHPILRYGVPTNRRSMISGCPKLRMTTRMEMPTKLPCTNLSMSHEYQLTLCCRAYPPPPQPSEAAELPHNRCIGILPLLPQGVGVDANLLRNSNQARLPPHSRSTGAPPAQSTSVPISLPTNTFGSASRPLDRLRAPKVKVCLVSICALFHIHLMVLLTRMNL
jgi:hypothetical protein